jgi:hypothetical protein
MTGTQKRLVSIIRDGQLCFYCTSLGAVAIKDFINAKPSQPDLISLPLFVVMVCMIVSTFSYGISLTGKKVQDWKLATISVCMAIVVTVFVLSARIRLGLL